MIYSTELLERVCRFCEKNKCGKILWVKDQNQQIHASTLLVWDDFTTYYLAGVTDPQYKSSGAMSLLLWEAIQFSLYQNKDFDLEGSMIETVERYFRAFGAIQTPYLAIHKTPSFLFRKYLSLKGSKH